MDTTSRWPRRPDSSRRATSAGPRSRSGLSGSCRSRRRVAGAARVVGALATGTSRTGCSRSAARRRRAGDPHRSRASAIEGGWRGRAPLERDPQHIGPAGRLLGLGHPAPRGTRPGCALGRRAAYSALTGGPAVSSRSATSSAHSPRESACSSRVRSRGPPTIWSRTGDLRSTLPSRSGVLSAATSAAARSSLLRRGPAVRRASSRTRASGSRGSSRCDGCR